MEMNSLYNKTLLHFYNTASEVEQMLNSHK